DQQFAFNIGRYILDNFQRRRLFYTTNHPNGRVIGMLMQYLLRHIGIDDVYLPTATLDHLNRLQVPVHPKVAKDLGVKWAGENTRYQYGGEKITWEIYVRRYIEHYG
ncbi:MAG: WcbI family polysaccharide biosynthesis putative acetyltransferase, partial [Stellaceae bacterium]